VWSGARPIIAPISFGNDPVAWHIPAGPLFTAYQLYLVACLAAAVLVLGWLYQTSRSGTPMRARFGGLLVSGALFLGGGMYLGIASGGFGFSALPGEIVLVTGMLVMGWNVARYGALVSGETVAADFRAFAISTLTVVGLYGGLLLFVPRSIGWAEGERFLLLIVLTTHTLAEHAGALLDRVVFDPVAGSLRGRLRGLADRVVRNPDPATALVDVREDLS